MHPAFLYLPGGRLTAPELSAARLDGHLVELGEGYIPADLVESASARAAAVATLIPADTAASGPTAAWIHGAGDAPPARHHVRRAVQRRIRPAVPARVTLHDTALPSSDLVWIGGVPVMTPARTMIDLALGLYRDESLRRWMVLLSHVDPQLVSEALTDLDALSRVPGKRAGRGALERLLVRTM
ncbi:type IV toxin-antitoxin system AbiEi family antitoxin [Microbacterium sp. WCS2018Hpa-23]|uniref:type IV toxin-antitoxin system AbiEi family antitoxin n=1 Tax=Microbacterium sp. WCS2018Hpa-23 TaxID=3073634 RepID=UPI00288305DA|nr:type IV toxin-antitoxin system AbiEi family antitoxin [Microbacterium sp. WCS2018Hpa-23]